MRLARLVNVDDVEAAARRRLPRPVFDVVAGGADDEQALARNREALAALRLCPRTLRDVRERDLTITLFGESYAVPVLLAPIGYQRLVHRGGEAAAARAASKAGTALVLSSGSSCSPAAVAEQAPGQRWFQLYPASDRGETARLLERVWDLGYSRLCVTIDTPMHAVRERDVRNRMTMPLVASPRLVLASALRPRWTASLLSGGAGRGLPASRRFPTSMRAAQHATGTRTGRVITVQDVAWLRERWRGPMLLKGVLRAEDVDQLIGLGIDGIVVSNHGGRQLDAAPATIDVLPAIVAAAAGRVPVLVDGGFRRGADVVKALALGAAAVLIGRPYVFGLAVAGEAGVAHTLGILRAEIDTAMGLVGAAHVDDLDPSLVLDPSRR